MNFFILIYLSVMNIEQWSTRAAVVHSRGVDLNLPLKATLQLAVHSIYFSHTTNEKKEVNKSFSVKWPLNSKIKISWNYAARVDHCSMFITVYFYLFVYTCTNCFGWRPRILKVSTGEVI